MPEISLPFCKRKLVGSRLEDEYQRAARRAEKQIPQPVDGNAYNPMPANMGLRLTWVEVMAIVSGLLKDMDSA